MGIFLCRYYDIDFKGSYNFYGGVFGSVFILCIVLIIYNYDYVFDYIFYFNGVLEVRIIISGYV